MKVLIADEVSPICAEVLRRAGLEAAHRPGLGREELMRAIADAEGLVVRSDTQVTEEVIAAARACGSWGGPAPAWTTSTWRRRPAAAWW